MKRIIGISACSRFKNTLQLVKELSISLGVGGFIALQGKGYNFD